MKPMSPSRRIRIRAIYLSPGHDFKGRFGQSRLNHTVESPAAVECHAGRGIVGDRYYDHRDDYKGQITFFDAAAGEALAEERGWPAIDWQAFRRNVILEGADLNALVGRRFRLGEVTLEGAEECAPCFWMNEAFGAGTEEWLRGRGGLRCRILESGWLRSGPVELEICA